MTAVLEALNLPRREKRMTSANTEDGSSALPFIFLSFVLQFGALIAFTLIALGSFLAVAFSLKMEQFNSPGRHQNESLHSQVLSITCIWWECPTAEVASTPIISPKTQSLPQVPSAEERSLDGSFGKY